MAIPLRQTQWTDFLTEENTMNKILTILLVLAMIFSFAACGEKKEEQKNEEQPVQPQQQTESYEIAFITDAGPLMDGSFNQGTWEGVESFAKANGKTCKYYQPADESAATDDDRYAAMKAAIGNGAKIVVCSGDRQRNALGKIAAEAKGVAFIFIDGEATGAQNVAGIAFKEEQCGYLAGYAVVKEGFTKLGFSGGGGGENAACCRYGYGFAQGANAAAAELGTEVELNYTWKYGDNFEASQKLYTLMNGWYSKGTEIVFACGGTISDSVFLAAEDNSAKGVGVDVDQSTQYPGVVITSAMKGLSAATEWALNKFYQGKFAEIANTDISLGAVECAVGLPTATWQFTKWSVDEYEALLKGIVDGRITIDNTHYANDEIKGVDFSNLTIHYE